MLLAAAVEHGPHDDIVLGEAELAQAVSLSLEIINNTWILLGLCPGAGPGPTWAAHRSSRWIKLSLSLSSSTAVSTTTCTVQYSTAQYSTVQYSTVQYSAPGPQGTCGNPTPRPARRIHQTSSCQNVLIRDTATLLTLTTCTWSSEASRIGPSVSKYLSSKVHGNHLDTFSLEESK